MVLYLVGLGLGSLDDVTLRGHRAMQSCSKIYLEAYTSLQPGVNAEVIARTYDKVVVEADRMFVELGCDAMLDESLTEDVCFLVVGDPFGATTHADLFLRAREKQVTVQVIHNASIMNAVGCCGLQLYRFGQTVSIPFFDGNWKPRSFLDKIRENMSLHLHTLVLLDIKVKEQSVENMAKGRKIFEPPRFMTVNQAIEQILYFEDDNPCVGDKTRAFGLARVGCKDQLIVSGLLTELQAVDFGRELHSLIICAADLHEIEATFYDMFHTTCA